MSNKKRAGSSASRKSVVLGSSFQPLSTRAPTTLKRVNLKSRKAQDDYRVKRTEDFEARNSGPLALSATQQQTLDALRNYNNEQDLDFDEDNEIRIEDVLDGTVAAEISHGGQELLDAARAIEEEREEETRNKHPKCKDWRTRRDRVERHVYAFASQMEDLVDMYIHWITENEPPPPVEGEPGRGECVVQVVDIFKTYTLDAVLDSSGRGIAASLIKQGLFPCAPWLLSVVITTRTLEFFRATHCRCPHLAIQPFVKSLCDIHGVAYKPYLCQQFSITYNVYLDVKRKTELKVLANLGRDSKNWRLTHGCPACMYELEGEELMFRKLFCFNGNESLRRVFRKVKKADGSVDVDEMGMPLPPESRERTDTRNASKDYWRSREEVDQWVKTKLADLLPQDKVPGDDSPCHDRWKNMMNEMTAKIGELAKYPLAMIDALLDALGDRLGAGYDIGCHTAATISKSDLNQKASEKLLTMLVGAFHGHGHNRLCQLKYLATYVKGLGLEDLEGCERYFSKSNALAKAALGILATEPTLRQWMRREGVASTEEFEKWLAEEKEWLMLKKNSKKSQETSLEMEYVQKLVNLSSSDDYNPSKDAAAQRSRRHAEEIRNRDLASVIDIKEQLDITARWTSTSPEWAAAVKLVKEKKFTDALNALELLIVERIFELTKVNRSGIAYKMRTHIAKALQARSVAIKNAISRYNTAAFALEPPAPSLTWDQVVEYAFLADFDFLRATDGELLNKPWSRPAYRLAMDSYFKILHAREEICWFGGYQMERGRSDIHHMKHFWRLAKTPGFTRTFVPGVSRERREARHSERRRWRDAAREGGMDVEEEEEVVTIDMAAGWQLAAGLDNGWVDVERGEDGEEMQEDDEGEVEEGKELSELIYDMARMTTSGES
ncbi:hypothetical protein B0H14DRAFT_2643352 [Mycena olivaceomarginata]|nr:hypothetical protein B0H14DRAFT_2643352 [Mycena olivaceomarginata]